MVNTSKQSLLKKYAIVALVILLACSCGNEKGAASRVKEFVRENVVNGNDIHNMTIVTVDTTKFINDSTIRSIRQVASQAHHWKKDIKYGDYRTGEKLIYVIMKYKLDNKDMNETFYLDETALNIVGIKVN